MTFAVVVVKQKTADEMRMSDGSSGVCASDLLVIQGKTTKEIAQILDIGVKTAENHRARKIGRASSREGACQYVSFSVVAVTFKIDANKNIARSFAHTKGVNTQCPLGPQPLLALESHQAATYTQHSVQA